jgi:hypothetical protein
MIKEDTRVVVNTPEGVFHGSVVSIRYTNLLEFNPPADINPDKPNSIPNDVNIDRPVTVYMVLLDNETKPKEFYKFIKEE